MLCIHLKNTNPFFCLAAEEYLLKNFSDDIFMLWQSKDTVVVGKHQNALGEINYPFVRENNITVARRISGGGTVFHDDGNVNFAFIKNVSSASEISFKQFTKPIVESLAKLNVKAVNSGRNDLLVASKKISGNAEHIYKNRVLHHGTLLFNSDLKNLGLAIKVIPGKYITKAVQSNRSEVANISEFLRIDITLEEFIILLFEFELQNPKNKIYELNQNDIQKINKLSEEKFNTWDWNYGYSPKYSFQNKTEIGNKELVIKMNVIKGIISEIKISGNYFKTKITSQLSTNLIGKRHFYNDINQQLKKVTENVSDELVYAFF